MLGVPALVNRASAVVSRASALVSRASALVSRTPALVSRRAIALILSHGDLSLSTCHIPPTLKVDMSYTDIPPTLKLTAFRQGGDP
jgi:hypothetical protein